MTRGDYDVGLLRDPMQLMMLLTGVMGLFWLTLVIKQWPGVGWAAIGVAIVVASDLPVAPALGVFGGLAVYPEDALAIALGIIAALRLSRINDVRRGRSGVAVLFVLLVLASLVRGIAAFGLGGPTNEVRPLIYLIVAAAWVLAQREDERFELRLNRFVLATGLGLIAVAAYHVTTRGLGSADGFVLQRGSMVTNRALVSGQACVLAMIALYWLLQRRRAWFGWLMLLVVLLAQHRSVWVAAVAALVVAGLAASKKARARVLTGGVVAAMIATVILLSGAANAIMDKLSHSVSSTGTFDDRTYGWTSLIQQSHELGLVAVLFGQPMGSGWRRVASNGLVEEFGPHNWYVLLYLRIGLIGVAALVWLLVGAARRQLAAKNTTATVWLTVVAIYAVPYALPWYLAPFVAVFLAYRQGTELASRPAEASAPPADKVALQPR